MKKCTRFHFEDVERGDVLILTREDGSSIEVKVYGHYRSHNFGPVIRDEAAEDFYLDDYDDVKCRPKAQSDVWWEIHKKKDQGPTT